VANLFLAQPRQRIWSWRTTRSCASGNGRRTSFSAYRPVCNYLLTFRPIGFFLVFASRTRRRCGWACGPSRADGGVAHPGHHSIWQVDTCTAYSVTNWKRNHCQPTYSADAGLLLVIFGRGADDVMRLRWIRPRSLSWLAEWEAKETGRPGALHCPLAYVRGAAERAVGQLSRLLWPWPGCGRGRQVGVVDGPGQR